MSVEDDDDNDDNDDVVSSTLIHDMSVSPVRTKHLRGRRPLTEWQDLSPMDDVQGHKHTRQADRNRNQENANANADDKVQSGSKPKSIFGRNFGRDPTKTRKLSFSFPLRRLHKDKEKSKEEGKTKTRG